MRHYTSRRDREFVRREREYAALETARNRYIRRTGETPEQSYNRFCLRVLAIVLIPMLGAIFYGTHVRPVREGETGISETPVVSFIIESNPILNLIFN